MLQELFNVLDLPGSSVRDVLAGENPFDQWTSPLSDDHRTSGAKLVNRWTGADENSWGGMIGGMGAEMLLDPMNLLPGFGVMKRALTAKRIGGLNRGIRAANEAQQALDAGRYGFVNAQRLAGGADEAVEAAGPLQQKLLGYDPGVTENYQSISHGTSNPFAGSDDFPAGKLDLRYMGTGEGNQAFGWGSYSAQDPKVSATYKEYGGSNIDSNWVPSPLGKAAMRRAARLTQDPQFLEQLEKYAERTVPWHARDRFVQNIVAGAASDPTTAHDLLSRFGNTSMTDNPATDLWRFREPASEVPAGPFHMQLNLPKEAEDRMIRGDVPLAGQPPLVQQALQEVQQEISPISIEKVAGTDLIKKSLERVYRQGGLQDPIHVASNLDEREVPQKVAEYLQSKGIVGNKFLDRSSRKEFAEAATADIEFDSPLPPEMKDTVEGFARQEVEFAADEIKAIGGLTKANVIPAIRHSLIKKLNGITFYLDRVEEGSDMYPHLLRNEKNVRAALQLLRESPPKVIVKAPSLSQPGYTSNYAIWDQHTLDKTRIRKINGVNIPLANMLKGGRARPTEAALDLVQSTQPMGSPLMQELPVPSLLSRKEALALGIYNVAARGGFTVE